MTLEQLIRKLDGETIVRIVDVNTIYHGAVRDFYDIKICKEFVRQIFHYPAELLITLEGYRGVSE